MQEITTAVAGLLGAAFLWVLALLVAYARKWFVGRANRTVRHAFGLDETTVMLNRKINSLLKDLRSRYDAARAAVFQFHNGDVFLMADHTWKLTCTHELAAEGVTHTLRDNQGLLVSRVIDWVAPIIAGESDGHPGVTMTSVCGRVCDGVAMCPLHKGEDEPKVFLFNSDALEPSLSKLMAEQQGVGAAYCVPLVGPDKKSVMGFISLQFRSMHKAVFDDFESAGGPCALCAVAKEIQFLLREANTERKR